MECLLSRALRQAQQTTKDPRNRLIFMSISEIRGCILSSAEGSRNENCVRENNPWIIVWPTKFCDISVSALLPHAMCHLSCWSLLHEELQGAALGNSPLSDHPCTNPAQSLLHRRGCNPAFLCFLSQGTFCPSTGQTTLKKHLLLACAFCSSAKPTGDIV